MNLRGYFGPLGVDDFVLTLVLFKSLSSNQITSILVGGGAMSSSMMVDISFLYDHVSGVDELIGITIVVENELVAT